MSALCRSICFRRTQPTPFSEANDEELLPEAAAAVSWNEVVVVVHSMIPPKVIGRVHQHIVLMKWYNLKSWSGWPPRPIARQQ
jgi:hypothetical protein